MLVDAGLPDEEPALPGFALAGIIERTSCLEPCRENALLARPDLQEHFTDICFKDMTEHVIASFLNAAYIPQTPMSFIDMVTGQTKRTWPLHDRKSIDADISGIAHYR